MKIQFIQIITQAFCFITYGDADRNYRYATELERN